MLVFGKIRPEESEARAVSCISLFAPLFAVAERQPISPRENKAAMTSVMNVIVKNGFFNVMAIYMRTTFPD